MSESMSISRFQIRLSCACGRTSEVESALARPGALAPIPCTCGRSFVLQQLDPKDVIRLAVDPTGITDGAIPEDPDLPKVH